jgi:hypothetical protein
MMGRRSLPETPVASEKTMNTQTYSTDKSECPVAKSFYRLYKRAVNSGSTSEVLSASGVTALPGGRSGFAGSGETNYAYQGHRFSVSRGANGKTFYGTHHCITYRGLLLPEGKVE